MKQRNASIFVFVGAWLSLVSVLVGGSVLLPPSRSLNDASTALLYRYADAHPERPTASPATLGRSLVVDLNSMRLSLYEEGLFIKSFPVLSKGRPGTAWETPTGNYVIQARELKHLSTIGGTWMPYSMQFFGNFFIHGWPTYADGRDVPIGYSGGCIRLSTDDAKEVYNFIPRGAHVTIIGGTAESTLATSSRYFLHGDGTLPQISAPSFLVKDLDGSHILWEQSAEAPVHPKGLTRLLTALTAVETVNQYKIVRMSELLLGKSVLRKYSIGSVDEMQAGVLIYPLLFGVNDTASKVFASEHGEKQFVASMNEKSLAIGMTHSSFDGPLSNDASTSTAEDIETLLSYIKQNKNFLVEVTRAENKVLHDEKGAVRFEWENKNPWVVNSDGDFRGGVADLNEDGGGSAALLFDVPVSEFSKRTIAFVVIDSTHLLGDISALRQFVSTNYVYGIETDSALFIPEKGEESGGIFEKAKQLMDLERWLHRSKTQDIDV